MVIIIIPVFEKIGFKSFPLIIVDVPEQEPVLGGVVPSVKGGLVGAQQCHLPRLVLVQLQEDVFAQVVDAHGGVPVAVRTEGHREGFFSATAYVHR